MKTYRWLRARGLGIVGLWAAAFATAAPTDQSRDVSTIAEAAAPAARPAKAERKESAHVELERLTRVARRHEAAKPVAAPHDDSLTYLRAVLLEGAKVDGLSSLETNVVVTEILEAERRSFETGKPVRIAAGPGRGDF